jgi:hypothetical protein
VITEMIRLCPQDAEVSVEILASEEKLCSTNLVTQLPPGYMSRYEYAIFCLYKACQSAENI